MSYFLVDKINGVGNSRRVIRSFGSYQDAKEWINSNVDELYGFIPEYDPTKAPDFKRGRSLEDLNKRLQRNSYHGWRLKVIKVRDTTNRRRKTVLKQIHKSWYSIRPMEQIRGSKYTDNGVKWTHIQTLTKEEQNIIKYASLARVLKETKLAVLVEWSGRKGSSVTWIPKQAIAN